MPTRRTLLATAAMVAMLAVAPRRLLAAPSTDQARGFVDSLLRDLVGIVNGPTSAAAKQEALKQIILTRVDIPAVARFTLGRYWNTATPAQQSEFTALFQQVLIVNITSKVGEYSGVTYTMGGAAPRDPDVVVNTTVTRPQNAPAKVDWVVGNDTGALKLVDLIAEGTSLRLTQRNDYSSFMAHHGNNLATLIDAVRNQVSKPG